MDEDYKKWTTPHMMATGCLLGSQSLQKLLCHASLNISVLKIVSVWDEWRGWSSGRAEAVWSSLGESETVVRWGAQGTEQRGSWLRETAGDCHLRGTAIQRRSVVGTWGRTDRETDGALPLVDSTNHTPKLSIAIIHFDIFLLMRRLTCYVVIFH